MNLHWIYGLPLVLHKGISQVSPSREIWMSIGDFRNWCPSENPEIINEWETQHDFVMLFNLYTLIRDVNQACDESGIPFSFLLQT